MVRAVEDVESVRGKGGIYIYISPDKSGVKVEERASATETGVRYTLGTR